MGALAYADDIVLLAPTPTAMRKLLSICDIYALKYDIIFNAAKSKFLVVVPGIRRSLQNILSGIVFYVGGSVIEYVESYVHLGHIIITSKITDEEDILQRRNCFVGQVNNVLCFFVSLTNCLLRLNCLNRFVLVFLVVSYGHWTIGLLMNFVLHGVNL